MGPQARLPILIHGSHLSPYVSKPLSFPHTPTTATITKVAASKEGLQVLHLRHHKGLPGSLT